MAESTPTTVWMVKPPSKTVLFTAEYPLVHTPEIYVLEVEVTSGPTRFSKPQEFVESQRLRRAAIEDWARLWLSEFTTTFGIKFRFGTPTGGNPIDHIALLLPPTLDVSTGSSFATFVKRATAKPLGFMVYEVDKTVRNDIGELEGHEITCAVKSSYTLTANKKSEHYTIELESEYWKKLDLILRQQVTKTNLLEGTRNRSGEILLEAVLEPPPSDPASTTSSSPTTAEFSSTVTTSPPPTSLTSMTRDPTLGGSKEISVLVRAKGRLELRGTTRAFKFELDLVPGIRKGKNVAQVVDNVYEHSFTDEIRAMLVGLEVIKNYHLPDAQEAVSDEASENSSNPHENVDSVQIFTIRDVRMPAKMPAEDQKFSKDGTEYTVTDYFQNSKIAFLAW